MLTRWQHTGARARFSGALMKIATLAVLAASILTLAIPSLAEAGMMHRHRSHMMMHRHHRMHIMDGMRGHGGKMAGHRTF